MKDPHANQIVLVDDDPEYVYLVEQALMDCSPAGSLKVLPSGSALLAWLETEPNRPRLILLDINMPIATGFDVLKILKSDDRYKMIPVVMLSVSAIGKDVGQAYDSGANAYLVKPGQLSELRRRLTFFSYYWFNISQTPGNHWGDSNWHSELN